MLSKNSPHPSLCTKNNLYYSFEYYFQNANVVIQSATEGVIIMFFNLHT